MIIFSSGSPRQTGDRRQGRGRQEDGGRGVSPSRDDDQEEAQGPLQEHDQVQKAASQRGQAPREEEEGARRAGH